MDGFDVFILRATEVKHANDNGQAGKDARKERKMWSEETLSDRRVYHIDQQITTVYIGGKESSPSTGERHPRVRHPPETFSISHAILYRPDEQDKRVRAHVYVCDYRRHHLLRTIRLCGFVHVSMCIAMRRAVSIRAR